MKRARARSRPSRHVDETSLALHQHSNAKLFNLQIFLPFHPLNRSITVQNYGGAGGTNAENLHSNLLFHLQLFALDDQYPILPS
jgi:hypothetical protein